MLVPILSWTATGLGLAGQILVAKKKRIAFPVWFIGNSLWIVINFLTTFNTANVVMYAAYNIINIHGFISWKKSNEKQTVKDISKTLDSFALPYGMNKEELCKTLNITEEQYDEKVRQYFESQPSSFTCAQKRN